MKFCIKTNTLLLFLMFSCVVQAQEELLVSQMLKIGQHNSINPASFPENKRLVIGLPGFGVDAYHSGSLTYNDFFYKQNGKTVVDFDQIVNQLEPSNELSYRQRLEVLSIGFRLPGSGKSAVTLSHAIRLNSNTTYSKELVQLMWGGNAQFIGQTIQVAPSTRTHDWHEIGLGVSRRLGKLRAGAKIKYLAGISALLTNPNANKMTVYTNPDIYQLELSTDYGFQSAGVISAIDTSGFGFDVVTNELKNKLNGANSGLAFDLGVTYEISDKLTVHAAALDLAGSIRWEAAHYFSSKADYSFDGVTIPGADIINGTDNLDFSAKLDTLNDIFKFNKTTTDFSTAIPSRFYIGANYDLTKRITLAGSLYFEDGLAEKKTAFGLSAHFKPIKLIGVGVMYAANKQNQANIGAQLTLSPGPIQFFIASDNLLGVFTPFRSSRVNLRTGLALML